MGLKLEGNELVDFFKCYEGFSSIFFPQEFNFCPLYSRRALENEILLSQNTSSKTRRDPISLFQV